MADNKPTLKEEWNTCDKTMLIGTIFFIILSIIFFICSCFFIKDNNSLKKKYDDFREEISEKMFIEEGTIVAINPNNSTVYVISDTSANNGGFWEIDVNSFYFYDKHNMGNPEIYVEIGDVIYYCVDINYTDADAIVLIKHNNGVKYWIGD